MSDVEATFSFGKNWETFIENFFTDERVEISKEHLLNFLQLEDLSGKYFLDVGCGSGLSSLAAIRAGADRVVSFDVDPHSVKTAQYLREREGSPVHWTIFEGSVLDKEFMKTVEPADVLYSWGVLHHTGSMWEAIENTMQLMKPDGIFYVALYTTTHMSDYWIVVKKRYNQASTLKKRFMEAGYVTSFIINELRQRKNPFSYIRNYKKSRGMEFMTDVRDWLGGWPYEDATVEEVQKFFAEHNFKQINIKTGEANTEYLFSR